MPALAADGCFRKAVTNFMRTPSPHGRRLTTKLQLVLLLIAAMALVATMLAGFVGGHPLKPGQLDLNRMAVIGLVAAAVFIAGLIVWHMGSVIRKEATKAKAESQ